MRVPTQGKIVRIFVEEKDIWQGKPLYEQIVLLAKKQGMAGATVMKGFMGFGRKNHMHTAKLLELSEDLPMIVEIVDSSEKITRFVAAIDSIIGERLVVIENAGIILSQPQ